jgi:hypothetical protein
MKLISEHYRKLKPQIEYLADQVVIAQAWKKTHGYMPPKDARRILLNPSDNFCLEAI